MAKEWGGKLNSTDQFTMNTVTPKCEELVRLHDLCTESLRYKQMLAEKQSTLYVHIDEVGDSLVTGCCAQGLLFNTPIHFYFKVVGSSALGCLGSI